MDVNHVEIGDNYHVRLGKAPTLLTVEITDLTEYTIEVRNVDESAKYKYVNRYHVDDITLVEKI